MKRYVYLLGLVFVLLQYTSHPVCWAGERWKDLGGGFLNVQSVLIDPSNSKILYAATERGVFKSENRGDSWRNVFLSRGSEKPVNLIVFGPDRKSIYAATGAGLFLSQNKGLSWRRVFKGKNYLEANCKALAILPEAIYLGTGRGLFKSADKGRTWHKESGRIGDGSVYNIDYSTGNGESLYIATSEGVFRNSNKEGWVQIYTAHSSDVIKASDSESLSGSYDYDTKSSQVRYITINPNNPKHICLATSRGIYESRNEGLSWQLFPSSGLLSRDTFFLKFSGDSQLYCINKAGVFIYKDSLWHELSFGLATKRINFIAFDKQNLPYIGTEKGLFKLEISPKDLFAKESILREYFKDEPGIAEIQRAAIDYAEVNPGKIALWRKQAVKKAWLPRLTANFGRDTTDLWHWETGSSAIGQSGDDLLRRGRDSLDWDVGLTWDLGELIWNNDQTSIDTRSKLMVELRNDILDEVNKTYFERIRVKMELDNLSIEEKKKRSEKELRLEELTASIDALTGGYFSRYTPKKKT